MTRQCIIYIPNPRILNKRYLSWCNSSICSTITNIAKKRKHAVRPSFSKIYYGDRPTDALLSRFMIKMRMGRLSGKDYRIRHYWILVIKPVLNGELFTPRCQFRITMNELIPWSVCSLQSEGLFVYTGQSWTMDTLTAASIRFDGKTSIFVTFCTYRLVWQLPCHFGLCRLFILHFVLQEMHNRYTLTPPPTLRHILLNTC